MQGGDNLGQVSEFLRAADGAVKIEDVLPLFPDFARIDAFKGASPLPTFADPFSGSGHAMQEDLHNCCASGVWALH
jgi:hypothetical protein